MVIFVNDLNSMVIDGVKSVSRHGYYGTVDRSSDQFILSEIRVFWMNCFPRGTALTVRFYVLEPMPALPTAGGG